jgi:hypothetical protein
MATIYLTIKHYKDDDGLEHIDIGQILTGGVGGTQEIRVLNWQERSHEDHVFGPVVGKSRRIKVEDVENDWLKQSWSVDTQEHGLVNSWVQSDTPKSGKTWIAEQVCITLQNINIMLRNIPRLGASRRSVTQEDT